MEKEHVIINTYENIFDLLPVGFLVLNNNNEIIKINNLFCKLLECEKHELLNTNFFNIIEASTLNNRYINNGFYKNTEYDMIFTTNNNIRLNTVVHIVPIEDINGQNSYHTYIFATCNHFLFNQSNNSRYQRIVNSITDYIYNVTIFDEDNIQTIHHANSEKITGYPVEDYDKNPDLWIQMVHKDDRRLVRKQVDKVFAGKEVKPIEHRIIKKDGSLIWVESIIVPDYDENGNLLAYDGVIHDITKRKETETLLKYQESLYKKANLEKEIILSAISECVIFIDTNYRVIWANKAAMSQWNIIVGGLCYEVLFEKNCSCTECMLFKIKKEKKTVTREFRVHNKYYFEKSNPVYDLNNELIGIVKIIQDITEVKNNEIKEKLREEQLIKTEKMASLGVLVSGIAHEINNPNNFILLNSSFIYDVWKDSISIIDEYYHKNQNLKLSGIPYPELKPAMDEIIDGLIEGSRRIENIVRNLRDFSQPDTGRWNQTIDVNLVIKSAIIILNNIIKKTTDHFFVDYGEDIPIITGNYQQLEQVIINLILNSCQSLKGKDRAITVASGYDTVADNIVLTIMDEGVGIPQEHLKKIVDPFFTTKLDSGGTGLGLSISYSIIKKFNGELYFESNVGAGTIATIKLPVLTVITDDTI